jgi:hypothetical protein
MVHALPSSHVLGTLRQEPVAGSQESSVQGRPSPQALGIAVHVPVALSHRPTMHLFAATAQSASERQAGQSGPSPAFRGRE